MFYSGFEKLLVIFESKPRFLPFDRFLEGDLLVGHPLFSTKKAV